MLKQSHIKKWKTSVFEPNKLLFAPIVTGALGEAGIESWPGSCSGWNDCCKVQHCEIWYRAGRGVHRQTGSFSQSRHCGPSSSPWPYKMCLFQPWLLMLFLCRFLPFPASIQMWLLLSISCHPCKPFTRWMPSSPRFKFPWMSICPRSPLRRMRTSHLRSQRTFCLPRCSSLMFTRHLQGQHRISLGWHLHDWQFCSLCNLIDQWEDSFKHTWFIPLHKRYTWNSVKIQTNFIVAKKWCFTFFFFA